MMYTVEDVAVEARSRSKYGWGRLKVGQSIVTEKNAVSAANNWGSKNGAKFASTKVEGGYRIGRIS